ncbi:MAG: twin-arginine translocation signal domain-containing protein [Acidiferrobacterales bacterium]
MSRKSKPARKSRREFLKGAAVVGSAATLAAVAGGGAASVQEAKEVVKTSDKSKGYHVTPHIRTYYDLAKQ